MKYAVSALAALLRQHFSHPHLFSCPMTLVCSVAEVHGCSLHQSLELCWACVSVFEMGEPCGLGLFLFAAPTLWGWAVSGGLSLSHRSGSYVHVLFRLRLGNLEVSHLFSWRFLQLQTSCWSHLWGCPAAHGQKLRWSLERLL